MTRPVAGFLLPPSGRTFRHGYQWHDQDTIEQLRKAMFDENGDNADWMRGDSFAKAISTSTGIVAYDLQAPAKNLYPVVTPIRNVLPRVGGGTGTATNWRQVNSITGSGFDGMGWVPEGQRAGQMSYSTSNKSASYVTIGEEDAATFEAIAAGRGFEDIQARMTFRLLQKMMLKEEIDILGGNASLTLGTPGTVAMSASGSGSSLTTTTYYAKVAALTLEGWVNWTNGAIEHHRRRRHQQDRHRCRRQDVRAERRHFEHQCRAKFFGHGRQHAVPERSSHHWSGRLCVVCLDRRWRRDVEGGHEHQRHPAVRDHHHGSTVVCDHRRLQRQPELRVRWPVDHRTEKRVKRLHRQPRDRDSRHRDCAYLVRPRLGQRDRHDVPDHVEQFRTVSDRAVRQCAGTKNITSKVLNGTSSPLLRYTEDGNGANAYELTASGTIAWYYKPFNTANGTQTGLRIPVKLHPRVPPGTIIGWAQELPIQYQSNEVPNVAEMKIRQDYYEIEWPIVTRQRQVGVYAEEVLAIYAPFAMGVLTNIANG